MPEYNWNDLKYILAVSRTGSYAAAGRKLDVNERTVSRRIDALEACLQARLFDRGETGLLLTAAGEQAVATAEQLESSSQALSRQIGGADHVASGRVRLTAVPMLINRLLLPSLRPLTERHASLEIELIAEARDLSLTRREADLALRLARPERETQLLTRRLGHLDYAIYTATGLDPATVAWVGYDDGMRHLPQARWITGQIQATGEERAPVAVNDIEGILASLHAGLGKSLLPTRVGDAEPGLVRVGNRSCLRREIWMLVHPELRRLARIRVLIDWLETLFAEPGSG